MPKQKNAYAPAFRVERLKFILKGLLEWINRKLLQIVSECVTRTLIEQSELFLCINSLAAFWVVNVVNDFLAIGNELHVKLSI